MSNILTDKKILVTGGRGFLGSHIVKKLIERGVQPENIFSPSSSELDLRKPEDCESAVRGKEIIIHAAGITGDSQFHRDHPADIFYGNLIMGMELMEAAHRENVEKFVAIGSATEYPKSANMPFSEKEIWEGLPEPVHAPYALAKRALMAQGQAYRAQYGFHAIHLIMTSVYGDGARDESGPIPSLIKRIISAQRSGEDSVVVWGTGKPMRDFLYVDDAAEGIVLAAEKYDNPDPVNLGSGREISIKDAVGLIAEIIGFKGNLVFDATKPDGQMRRVLDISRAEQQFGFLAKTSLEEGLRKTIKWYNSQI
ncbi:MAG TPA: NAD-dependent epimerase/dehydratase family protein [Candidatus Paceibacterota bacterium]|nr:NAD-dependent epimerase/dehydratase family protein [Candidatus Paceibacterota bacterium]